MKRQDLFKYKVFISYSHAADGKLAPALQSALHRFTRPWYQIRALRVFRDDTNLSTSPGLWSSIEQALGKAEFFLLLASPQAAGSKWVRREVDFWLTHRSSNTLLVALTDGNLSWDSTRNDLDWEKTTALPPNLSKVFSEEPLYLDLRWAKTSTDLSLNNPCFRDKIADLAATLHDRPKDEIIGEDVQQHRRTRRVVWSAALALLLLTLTSIGAAWIAWGQRNQAISRQLAAQSLHQMGDRLDLSLLLAVEATHVTAMPMSEARNSLLKGLQFSPFLARFINGYTGKVLSVAANVQSGTFASGSDDNSIALWTGPNSQDFRLLAGEQEGHQGGIVTLALSKDGRLLASGDNNGTFLIWDVGTGRPIIKPYRANYSLFRLAFSPDNLTVAIGTGDYKVAQRTLKPGLILWDIEKQEPRWELGERGDWVLSIAFSPDGKVLASGKEDSRIDLWEVETGRHRTTLQAAREAVRGLAFSPDGKILAAGSTSRTIDLWDLTGQLPEHLVSNIPSGGHTEALTFMAFSPDGLTLVSGSGDKTLILWNMKNVKGIRQLGTALRGHTEAVTSVAFYGNNTLLSTGGNLLQWDLSGESALAEKLTEQVGEAQILSLAFGPDRNTSRLVAGTGIGRTPYTGNHPILLWDLTKSRRSVHHLEGHTGWITSVAFSPDGNTLASGSNDKTIRLWDARSGKGLGTPLTGHKNSVLGLAFAPDGRRLVSGDMNHIIMQWDVVTHQAFDHPLRTITPMDFTYGLGFNMALSPDGSLLAIGFGSALPFLASSQDGKAEIDLWSISGEQSKRYTLKGHSKYVNQLSFSPDGTMLASASSDTTVILWDLLTHIQRGRPLIGHSYPVYSVVFSQDGQMIASGACGYGEPGCEIGEFRLWDAGTQQPIGDSFRAHKGWLTGLAFAPGSTHLATGGFDGHVLLWDLRNDTWTTLACRMANRNLTDQEWAFYLNHESYRKTCPHLP